MKKSLIVIIGLLLDLFILPLCAVAQDNPSAISGLVLDDRNKPIENVGIYRIDSTIISITDRNGLFKLHSMHVGDTIYTRHLAF